MKYRLELGKNQVELLEMGLRYLELHHEGKGEFNEPIDYKPDFRKLLTNINYQLKQQDHGQLTIA